MTQPIGDLAMFFTSRQRVISAQRDLARATHEVSSGLKHDLGASLNGDFSRLTSVERGLRLAETYSNGASLAQSVFAGMQGALERMQAEIVDLGPAILSVSSADQTAQLMTTVIGAEAGFSQAVSALNMQIGGRSAFAGAATNEIALIPAADILADLEVLVAGAPDAATMITLVDTYFNDPAGGYETTAYQGSIAPHSGFSIGEGDRAQADVSALDPAIRRGLSGLALASLLSRDAGPTDAAARAEIGQQAGQWMQQGYDDTVTLRAGIGVIEQKVDLAMARHNSTETALGIERARLVAADPFEAAVNLESVTTQLDTLYLMTARLQRLSLSQYL